MTGDDSAPPNPQMIASVVCDGCATAFVVARSAAAQPVPPTAQVGEWATNDGWRSDGRIYLTGWRCPRCRDRYGDNGAPRRFTIREVLARHRNRSVLQPSRSAHVVRRGRRCARGDR